VTITGSTNYNGIFVIANSQTNTYEITDTWAGDDAAGTWNQGSSLTIGTGGSGDFMVNCSCSATPQTNNETFELAIAINATVQTKMVMRRKYGVNGDYGSTTVSGILNVSDADIITFLVQNLDSAGNITIIHANLNMNRL